MNDGCFNLAPRVALVALALAVSGCTSMYCGRWLVWNRSGIEDLTLSHLMDMKSGIRWRDHAFITGDKASAYYDPNLRRLVGSIDFVRAAEERHRAI